MSVYSNENYEVVLGEGIDFDQLHYLVVNRHTKVVEVESRLFPQSIAYCNQLSDSYEECMDVINGVEASKDPTSIIPDADVVAFNKKH